MREQFAKTFMTKLIGKIPDDALKVVYQKLIIFVGDYEISPRNTELVPYEGYLPECYEILLCDSQNRGFERQIAGAVQYGSPRLLFSGEQRFEADYNERHPDLSV